MAEVIQATSASINGVPHCHGGYSAACLLSRSETRYRDHVQVDRIFVFGPIPKLPEVASLLVDLAEVRAVPAELRVQTQPQPVGKLYAQRPTPPATISSTAGRVRIRRVVVGFVRSSRFGELEHR